MSINLHLDIIANWCNHWPFIKVVFNGNSVFDQELTKETSIDCELSNIQDINDLQIVHYGKQQGEHKRWDTKTDNQGIIVEDCNFQITNLRFNDVAFNEIAFKKFVFNSSREYDTIYLNNIVGFNGEFNISFPSDIYSWLTILKYKQYTVDYSEQFSNTSQLFHYEADQQLIIEIKELLKI